MPQVHNKPNQFAQESFMCVLDGQQVVKMISPVFKQNLYQGVYEDLNPTLLPEDMNFFDIKRTKYPLLKEVEDYILTATMNKGDCLYIPYLWWVQTRVVSSEVTSITFTFQPSNRLSALMFEAISLE